MLKSAITKLVAYSLNTWSVEFEESVDDDDGDTYSYAAEDAMWRHIGLSLSNKMQDVGKLTRTSLRRCSSPAAGTSK